MEEKEKNKDINVRVNNVEIREGAKEKSHELWDDVKETVQSFKKKLPKQISSPSLTVFSESLSDSLVTATESLSLSLPSPKRIRERARTLGSDIRKLRSKSCERVLQRCRTGLEKVVKKDPQPPDYFHQQATLRRSRRSGKNKAKPCKRVYDSYARAVVNYTPSPYEEDGLALCVGDLVGVITRHPSGMWVGECQGKVGRFKFINVELVETKSGTCQDLLGKENIATMADLLEKLGLTHLTSKLELNGFDQLETLETVTRADLEFLAITDREEQDKLIAAGTFLLEKQKTEERLDSGYFDCENSDEIKESLPPLLFSHRHYSALSSTPRSSLCSSSESEMKLESSTLSLQSCSQQDISVFSSTTSLSKNLNNVFDNDLNLGDNDDDNVADVGDEDESDGVLGATIGKTQFLPYKGSISILSSSLDADNTF